MVNNNLSTLFRVSLLFICICYSLLNPLYGQEPANFRWGQEKFSGVDIYDLAEDLWGNYWISTNQGLYKYDGREFVNIPVSGSKSASFFNIQVDSKNQIFFHNLSGQIFTVAHDQGALHYQMPDSAMSIEMNIQIDNRDNLIVLTNAIYKLDQEKKLEKIFSSSSSEYKLFKAPDSSIMVYDGFKKIFYTYKNEQLTKRYIQNDRYIPYSSFIFSEDDTLIYDLEYLYQLAGDQLLVKDTLNFIHHQPAVRQTARETWVRHKKQGLTSFRLLEEGIDDGKRWFEDSFISALLEDSEHNLIIGTFGSGLIFIPAGPTKNYNDLEFTTDLRRISKGVDGNLFVTTVNSEVFQLNQDGEFKHVIDGEQHGAYLLSQWIESRDELWLFESGITRYSKDLNKIEHNHIASVKDIAEINSELFLLATNQGLAVLDFHNKRPEFLTGIAASHFKNIYWTKAFRERVHQVTYDSVNQLVYVSTSNGLKMINNKGEQSELKAHGISLVGKSIYSEGDVVYVGTQDNGLVKFRQGKMISHWDTLNTVEKIVPLQDFLVLLTDKGIKIKDKNGQTLKSLGVSDGLTRMKVSDIETQDSTIWLVHRKGIQRIDLSNITMKEELPDLYISSVMVNDQKTDLTVSDFSSDQNRFLFVLNNKSMKKKDEINYRFKLEGIDEDWQETSFYQNEIEYKSLPPGKYVFKASVSFKEELGKQTSYNFTINKPFYRQWWFFLFILMIILLTGRLIFKIQLKRKLSIANYHNELNLYKLKALRSQMNPHFMFNALNSIQEFIILNKKEEASNYLGKFSDLVRGYLSSSANNKISIEDELEIIQTYLELEEIRFEDEFIYTIDFDEELETPHFLIPTMLIQPYIENCIKHGLLHKKGMKRLKITGELIESSDGKLLTCTIEDNGIGRKRSMEMQQKTGRFHQSFATKANENRLKMLKKTIKQDVGVTIDDVLDKNGQIAGTIVVLKIPIEVG